MRHPAIETLYVNPHRPLRLNVRLFLLLLWGGAILALSLDPSPPGPKEGLLGWDKFQHAAAFGVLALLGGRYLIAYRGCRKGCWFKGFWLAVGYGAFIELAQAFLTRGRSAEWGDLLADAVGAGVVSTVAAFFRTTAPPEVSGKRKAEGRNE